jgi:hypothetical protein
MGQWQSRVAGCASMKAPHWLCNTCDTNHHMDLMEFSTESTMTEVLLQLPRCIAHIRPFPKKWGLSPVLIHCFKMMFHYKWIVSILVSILKQGYPQLSNGKRYPARFPSLRDWPWIFCAWGIGYGSKPWYPTPKIVDEWIWVYYNDSLTWYKASDIGYNI